VEIITDTYGRTIRTNSMPTPCWKIHYTTTHTQVDYVDGKLGGGGGGGGGELIGREYG